MSKDQDLEKFAQALQQQILEQSRNEYSEAVIERWMHPKNMGRMDQPDGYAKVTGSCGDTIEIFIKMDEEIISDCTFITDGCGATLACASMVTEIAREKSFTEALAKVSGEAIVEKLGGLPEGNLHCADLAAQALRYALADLLHQQKATWKKQYRKI